MNPDVDPTRICVEVCGAACCSGGAFLRPEDVDELTEAGYEDAIGDEATSTRTDGDEVCVLLDDEGRCTAYKNRPLDCRMFPLGYELDDDASVVRIVLVECPLSQRYTSEERRQLAVRGRALLEKFGAATLRRYDDLPFTGEHESLTTITYDTLPHDL